MYLSPATCSKGKSSRLGDFLSIGEEWGDKTERGKQNQKKGRQTCLLQSLPKL